MKIDERSRRGNPEVPKQDGAEHDALADARWVRDTYAWLKDLTMPDAS